MGGAPVSQRTAPRRAARPAGPFGTIPILSSIALLLSLAAAVLAANQGRDLIHVTRVLAAFCGATFAAAVAFRVSPAARRAFAARADRSIAAVGRALEGRRGAAFVIAMMAVYAVAWSVLSILRHDALNSSGFDLAIQHQVIWNLAHGRGFASSIEVTNYLGDHVCLTMPVFAPFLWIRDDVRMLLIAQSIVLALGAWPVYRIGRRSGTFDGVLWAAVYLLTPAIGFMNKYDFHEVVLAVPILLAGIDALDEGRMGRATTWFVLAIATREEIGIAVAAIAVWAAFARGRRKWAAILAPLAFAWAVFALYWVIPHFRGGAESDTIARYGWLGPSPGAIVRNVLTHPWMLFASHYHRVRRALFPVQLLWPTAGLPFLAPWIALLSLPSLAISLLSSNVSQNSIYFQYNAPVLPILFWAGIEGYRRAMRRGGGSRGLLAAALLVSVAFANIADPATVKSLPHPYAIVQGIRPRPNRAAFAEAARRIPPDAALIAGNDLAPHFSARARLYVYNPRKPAPEADWAIIDVTDLRHIDSAADMANGALALIGYRDYRIESFRDGILLLHRGGTADTRAAAEFAAYVRSLGLTGAGPPPGHPFSPRPSTGPR